MLTECPLARRHGQDASKWNHKHGVDDWVSDMRRICLDDLTRAGLEQRRPMLKDRLFPMSTGNTLTMLDVLYSEGVWAAGTLFVCFVAFALTTRSLTGALSFMGVAMTMILPLLALWAGLGYFIARRRQRRSRQSQSSR